MNVFITGVDGFVGQELRRQCDGVYRAYGIDIPVPRSSHIAATDIRAPKLADLIPDDAVVIHLAALSTDALCEAAPLEAFDVNVAGTINVAKAALKRKCRQFIFASTEKVYDDDYPLLRGETNDMFIPKSLYARSKWIAERVLEHSGIPNVTILRFGLAYGCRDTNWCAVEQIAADVVNGKPPFVGHPDTARRYVHVRDLCAGILAAVGRTGHETFNLPGERLITLKQVWEAAMAANGSAWSLLSETGSTPSVRNTDGTKAREVMGWVPQVPFAEGMKEVVEYIKGRKRCEN